MNNPMTVTVSQVNRRLSLMVKGDNSLADIFIRGELSNFIYHYKSGHIYFTLKDDSSTIKGVMFKGNAQSLRFQPENGMQVIVRGAIQVYERDGVYQIYATDIEPEGMGALYVGYEQLKARLELEGLFTKKRPIPAMPNTIVLITAKTGAALQDILSVITRRYPVVELLLISVMVQGENAPASIVSALELAQGTDADLIIIARGGGSAEDLWAFNDERVARAVYESEIPTISAVGHETDFTICDFVADLRAPTPSAAAEMAVPDIESIRLSLLEFRQAMEADMERRISRLQNTLDGISREIAAKSPLQKVQNGRERLEYLKEQINLKTRVLFQSKTQALASQVAVISSLNPIAVMAKGYATVYKDDVIVRSSEQVQSGDRVVIHLHQGEVSAIID